MQCTPTARRQQNKTYGLKSGMKAIYDTMSIIIRKDRGILLLNYIRLYSIYINIRVYNCAEQNPMRELSGKLSEENSPLPLSFGKHK